MIQAKSPTVSSDKLRLAKMLKALGNPIRFQIVETLAERRGRDLGAEGVAVVSMGGATNIRAYLGAFGPDGRDLCLAGLCDAREEPYVRRGLEAAGLGVRLDRAEMAALGFHVCVADLEDELIRALGAPAVERIVAAQGELGAFMRQLEQAYPATNARVTGEILAFTDSPRGPQRMLNTALAVLQGLMLLLLLAVCGNVATLMLARASARQKEVGIRLSLGARPIAEHQQEGRHRSPMPARLHEIAGESLDHRTGFLLSRIDGMLTFEDILDVAGMPRLEAYQILSTLLRKGVIEVR